MSDSLSVHLIGSVAALASAFLWAIAALMFARIGRQLSARAMNFGKGIIALVCLAALIIPTAFTGLTTQSFVFLSLSGLLGIALGDTLYFLTLQRLGARLTLLVGTLIPVVTAISAVILFKEEITFFAALGLVLTIAGVTYVLWDKAKRMPQSDVDENKPNNNKIYLLSSILIASIFVLSESAGILLTKTDVQNLDSLEATFIRQAWGVAGLFFWGLAVSNVFGDFIPLQQNKKLVYQFLTTSFIGAFLGTWLSIYALKMTYASVAVALNSTSPLFVIPIAVWFFKEKVRLQAVAGACIAVFGIMIYFLSMA